MTVPVRGATATENFVELESRAGRGLPRPPHESAQAPADAVAVVTFWREAGPAQWFAKDAEFDIRFRERFLALHEAAARGELRGWLATPDGALALLILLDQYPRNAFRGTP